MPRLPSVTPRKCIKALERAGFYLDRIRGSHHHYRYPNKPGTVTVAVHSGTIKRKTLTSIIKQAGMTVEEFLDLL
jgi:predicted RNA binding protein YcfA (HicA-like mRNA interferase family)